MGAPKPVDPAKKKKAVLKEGGKRGVEIEGAADMGGLQFFCTSVDEPEGDLDLMDECMKAMNEEADPTQEERKGGSGAIGKMIFAAGNHQGVVEKGSTKGHARAFITADGDKNKFPLKMKEPCITEAINFLKAKGLF